MYELATIERLLSHNSKNMRFVMMPHYLGDVRSGNLLCSGLLYLYV